MKAGKGLRLVLNDCSHNLHTNIGLHIDQINISGSIPLVVSWSQYTAGVYLPIQTELKLKTHGSRQSTLLQD